MMTIEMFQIGPERNKHLFSKEALFNLLSAGPLKLSQCLEISDFIFKYSFVNYKFTTPLMNLKTSLNKQAILYRGWYH